MKRILILGAMLALASFVRADDDDVQGLQDRVDSLESRVSDLEDQVKDNTEVVEPRTVQAIDPNTNPVVSSDTIARAKEIEAAKGTNFDHEVTDAQLKELVRKGKEEAEQQAEKPNLTPIGPTPAFNHPVWAKLLADWNAHHQGKQRLTNNAFGHKMVWPNTWVKTYEPEQYERLCKIISTTPHLIVCDAIDTEMK